VQGGKLALVDSADFVIIIMCHAKMSSLRHAAANTYVEVNSGRAAVIARVVQADSIQSVFVSDAIQDVVVPLIGAISASDVTQDVVIPPIQAVSASETVQDVVVPPIVAVQDVVMPPIEGVSGSDAVQNVIIPKLAVSVVSAATRPVAVKIRMRKVHASVLKTIPGIEHLDDCPYGKELRQVESGEIDAKGTDISGIWNLQDVGAAYLYDDSKNANRWAKGITTADASSLIKIPSGNPSVNHK